MQDYLRAYQTTARPPLPCPQSPDTPTARAALDLPPLFVPAAIPVPSDSLGSTSNTSDGPSTHLPSNHEFRSTKTITGEYFESISAQTLYNHFSHEVGVRLRSLAPASCCLCFLLSSVGARANHRTSIGTQELRHHAYLSGNKMSPATAGTMESGSPPSTPIYPFYATDSPTTAYMTSTAVPGTPDYLMSIAASPKFDKHSFEVRVRPVFAGLFIIISLLGLTASRGGLGTTNSIPLGGQGCWIFRDTLSRRVACSASPDVVWTPSWRRIFVGLVETPLTSNLGHYPVLIPLLSIDTS